MKSNCNSPKNTGCYTGIMDLSTRGIHFYPEYVYKAYYASEETFSPDRQTGDRLRLVLVEHGRGLLDLSGKLLEFTAPTLMLLNENEVPRLEKSVALHARAVYFHPAILNSGFSFESIRCEPAGDELTYWQDRSTLRLFLIRRDGFTGLLPLGPLSTKRAVELFELDPPPVDRPARRLLGLPQPFIPPGASYPVGTVGHDPRAYPAPCWPPRTRPPAPKRFRLSPLPTIMKPSGSSFTSTPTIPRRSPSHA